MHRRLALASPAWYQASAPPVCSLPSPPAHVLLCTLQVWNLNRVTGVVGLFNVQASAAAAAPTVAAPAAPADRIAAAAALLLPLPPLLALNLMSLGCTASATMHARPGL